MSNPLYDSTAVDDNNIYHLATTPAHDFYAPTANFESNYAESNYNESNYAEPPSMKPGGFDEPSFGFGEYTDVAPRPPASEYNNMLSSDYTDVAPRPFNSNSSNNNNSSEYTDIAPRPAGVVKVQGVMTTQSNTEYMVVTDMPSVSSDN